MNRFRCALVSILFAVLFCLHAFQFPISQSETTNLSLSAHQVWTDNYQPAKTAIPNTQIRIRIYSSAETDGNSEPDFNLIREWGLEHLLIWLSGLCFMPWIVVQILSRIRYFLPERYWNLRNFQYRFSHTCD